MLRLNIQKRPASFRDIDLACLVHHQAYREVVMKQFGEWDEKLQDRFFRNDWEEANYEIILFNEKPCGYICVEYRAEDIHIREFVIAPEYQGRGIGTHLLQEIIEQAKSKQLPVRLGTFLQNKAVSLYQRLGFKEFGRTQTHILLEWNAS